MMSNAAAIAMDKERCSCSLWLLNCAAQMPSAVAGARTASPSGVSGRIRWRAVGGDGVRFDKWWSGRPPERG